MLQKETKTVTFATKTGINSFAFMTWGRSVSDVNGVTFQINKMPCPGLMTGDPHFQVGNAKSSVMEIIYKICAKDLDNYVK